MTRVLCLLLLALSACSFANDFDRYTFDPEDQLQDADPGRKPVRGSDAGADSEIEPPTGQDGATAAADAGDGGTAVPIRDAAQDAQSAHDAAVIDAAPVPGLEGSWDVTLRLTSETCPGNAPLDADTWALTTTGARAELVSTWWTLAGTVETGRAAAAFSGLVDGAPGGARTRWELTVHLDGAELAGELQQTTIYQDGGIGCALRREIRGLR